MDRAPCLASPRQSLQSLARLLPMSLLAVAVPLTMTGNEEWDPTEALQRCNVTWDSPSTGPLGSMPAGNGETGINLWVEPSGDIVFYAARTDAIDENERPCKLGRVRVRLTPNPIAQGFRQTLNLHDGAIDLTFGSGSTALQARVWVNAHRQVVHLEIRGDQPFAATASVELWRTEERRFRGPTGGEMREDHSVSAFPEAERRIYPDTLVTGEPDRLTWYHRNRVSPWRDSLRLQELDPIAAISTDPLLHRTFGAALTGTDLVRQGDNTLVSREPTTTLRIDLVTHTQIAPDLADWTAAVQDAVVALGRVDRSSLWEAHRQWWHAFWSRSYIFASGTPEAEEVTRAYVLQRWVQAGAGRGQLPIKFNGSLFVVEREYDPDYRRWGGAYWQQNTRLIYWAMLASGDFDMMRPYFDMLGNLLPLAEERSRQYFKHEGAFVPEVISFWGTGLNNYGRHEAKVGNPNEWINGPYTRHHYNGMLEAVALMIDYYRYTNDREFLRTRLVPFAGGVLRWWDRHWPLDAQGRLVITANALETYWDVKNNLPDIAGLRWNVAQLLVLPAGDLPEALRGELQALSAKLPELPRGEIDGAPVLLAAEPPLGKRMNHETPEMYAVYPYRFHGVGKPELELVQRTFAHRIEKLALGWQHDDVHAAFVGLADVARDFLVTRARAKDPASRFPVFWQTNYDWSPDQDHGSNLLKALQTMLLQEHDSKVLIGPAWPKDWDVHFRLHAPDRTVVSGRRDANGWTGIRAEPAARGQDVVVVTETP